MDFMEAKENLSDLISDYIAYESYCHVDYGENFWILSTAYDFLLLIFVSIYF